METLNKDNQLLRKNTYLIEPFSLNLRITWERTAIRAPIH